MDKRYQVFVSSTFTDLKEERSSVIQTLMEMDCIPAGMELFPAIDEQQWEFIKKIIDDCDYYLLIIGGRYGTIADNGLSYTEKEFDYAVSKGLKVVVLVHEDPESLPSKKTESSPEAREKLTQFIKKAETGRIRKTWSSVKELPGLVSLSMSKTIKTYPATGWVRADKVSTESNMRDLITLQKENEELRKKLTTQNEHLPSLKLDLVDFGDPFEFVCEYEFPRNSRIERSSFKATMTWKEIFYYISPYLTQWQNESTISKLISKAACERANKNANNPKVASQDLKTIGVQLIAYGLVKVENLKTINNTWSLFWQFTQKGAEEMLKIRTVQREKS